MNKKRPVVLLILNFLLVGFIAMIFYFTVTKDKGPFTSVLPFPIGAFLGLISGILSLIRRSRGWAIAGIAFAVAGILYYILMIILTFL